MGIEGQLLTADQVVDRVSRRVISALQQLKDCRLSGHDSVLANTWDEVCAQVQHEESLYWDSYDDTVRMFVQAELQRINRSELELMWLQTERGWEWSDDEPEGEADQREIPADVEDVAHYVVKRIYEKASNWSNWRIRKFLDDHY